MLEDVALECEWCSQQLWPTKMGMPPRKIMQTLLISCRDVGIFDSLHLTMHSSGSLQSPSNLETITQSLEVEKKKVLYLNGCCTLTGFSNV